MTKEERDFIHSTLRSKGFGQILVSSVYENGEFTQNRLDVHSNAIMLNPNVEEIKKLIGDKYYVSGDTNSETITIK